MILQPLSTAHACTACAGRSGAEAGGAPWLVGALIAAPFLIAGASAGLVYSMSRGRDEGGRDQP